MRRKGEQKLEKEWMSWGPGHPVYRMMADGDSWLDAWQTQGGMTYPEITRRTGIPASRLNDIEDGMPISRAEIDALADLWHSPASALIDSLPAAMFGDGEWQ